MRPLLLALIAGLFLGCSPRMSRLHRIENARTGVNFAWGKWLLNDVDAPDFVSDRLEHRVRRDFRLNLLRRIAFVPKSQKGSYPLDKILGPNGKELRKRIRRRLGADFIINVSARSGVEAGTDGNGYVRISVYDLNGESFIYSREISIKGESARLRDPQAQQGLILSAYRKLMWSMNHASLR